MTKILDGKKVANSLKQKLKKEINDLPTIPKLTVIQVGNIVASNVYIHKKKQISEELGLLFELLHYDNDISTATLIKQIRKLNIDTSVNGILIQLPLPSHIDSKKIIDLIDPLKDVDGLTSTNIGRLLNKDYLLAPCTANGIIKLLEYYNIPLTGKHVVIVGRSNLVGKPLSNLFLTKDATITTCHTKTKDLAYFTKQADIVAVATGHKHLINKDMIKENAVLIDVGISRINNKLYGDIDFKDVYPKCSYITPVPGGVGPMTVIMLFYNVVKAYKIQNNLAVD